MTNNNKYKSANDMTNNKYKNTNNEKKILITKKDKYKSTNTHELS